MLPPERIWVLGYVTKQLKRRGRIYNRGHVRNLKPEKVIVQSIKEHRYGEKPPDGINPSIELPVISKNIELDTIRVFIGTLNKKETQPRLYGWFERLNSGEYTGRFVSIGWIFPKEYRITARRIRLLNRLEAKYNTTLNRIVHESNVTELTPIKWRIYEQEGIYVKNAYEYNKEQNLSDAVKD